MTNGPQDQEEPAGSEPEEAQPPPSTGRTIEGTGQEGRGRTWLRTVLGRHESTVERDSLAVAEAPADPVTGASMGRVVMHPFRFGFLGGLGVLLAFVTYQIADTIRSTLVVIAVAGLLAIGLQPAVSFLVRRGLRRGLSVAAVFLGLLLVLAGAMVAIIPPIVIQVGKFISSLPTLISSLQHNSFLQKLETEYGLLTKLQNAAESLASGAAGGVLNAGVVVAGVVTDIFIILILALFFLAGFPAIKTGVVRLAPASRRPRVAELTEKVLSQMGGYLSGATLVALQAGLVAGVYAAIVGLPYPFAIALGAFILDFVPVVGPIVVGVSMAVIGFTQSITLGIVSGVFYLFQHIFEAYWLYPKVMRRQTEISTGWVVIAILLGGAMLGVTGALLAVPVAAGIQIIMRDVVLPHQDRK